MDADKYIPRSAEVAIAAALKRNKSVLLLGPRQTGKTTMLSRLSPDLYLTLLQPDVRQRYEQQPAQLIGEVEALAQDKGHPLVIVDEVQKVPELLDVAQYLIDQNTAKFILTGSSARKLRRGGGEVNLLPGRVIPVRMDPLSLAEAQPTSLPDLLHYGSLPGIVQIERKVDMETELAAYVTTYLEEEVRAEALVRKLGPFGRFLELAASESGGIVNLRKLSQLVGVAHSTIGSYYQILEDCLIIERIEPLTVSRTRKKLTSSDRFVFFDLGVRRLAAREGAGIPRQRQGQLFEHFVALELIRATRHLQPRSRLRFWRDPDGPEVDWVLDREGRYIPIEVKLTDKPSPRDARHLTVFLREYRQATRAFIVCTAPRRVQISKSVTAIPWQEIPATLSREE